MSKFNHRRKNQNDNSISDKGDVVPGQIDLTIEEGIITDVKFYGGCNGNLQGISRLVIGSVRRMSQKR